MNEDAWAVASILITLGCLGMAIWLIYELQNPLNVDENGNPITHPER